MQDSFLSSASRHLPADILEKIYFQRLIDDGSPKELIRAMILDKHFKKKILQDFIPELRLDWFPMMQMTLYHHSNLFQLMLHSPTLDLMLHHTNDPIMMREFQNLCDDAFVHATYDKRHGNDRYLLFLMHVQKLKMMGSADLLSSVMQLRHVIVNRKRLLLDHGFSVGFMNALEHVYH